MFGAGRPDAQLVSKAEWLDTLSTHCGIGLWDAVLYEGDAMHPKARWTWSAEFRRLLGYSSETEFPNVVQSWSDRLHPDDKAATFAAFGAT
jgi:PAS fold